MAEKLLARIRVVLVETTHPGNIGAVARAMKTMGLWSLYLVNPKQFPSAQATAMASGADDLLSQAVVVPTLADALADCHLVIGTSTRSRSLQWPVSSAHEAAQQLLVAADGGEVALVFGREHAGLSNLELESCQRVVAIDADENFSSLNVAAAVQILAYELRRVWLKQVAAPVSPTPDCAITFATADELAAFYAHLEATMSQVGFYDQKQPRQLMRRLKRLFSKTLLERSEVQILRGFLGAIDRLKESHPGQGSGKGPGKGEDQVEHEAENLNPDRRG